MGIEPNAASEPDPKILGHCATMHSSLLAYSRALRFRHHVCYHNYRMSAPIFTGDLQAVLPGELAVRGNPGNQCTVCKSCKCNVCKILA